MTGSSAERTLRFGPFRLLPERNALFSGEHPIRLGGRAFDILVALAARAGELVPREQLIAEVWPGIFVDESALRVHIAALRKALGDGQDGARYIVNVPGRGYRFAAPVEQDAPTATASGPAPAAAPRAPSRLPAVLTRMIGRIERMRVLAEALAQRRFLTIIGAGGIGKTTVALSLAESIAGRYPDGAHFADLASFSDGAHLPAAIAAACNLSLVSADPAAELLALLRTRTCLLVLDNCEHLIESVAPLAEALHHAAPGLHLLATSREPLRAAGEWVHRLPPLAVPPEGAEPDAAEAMTFSAVRLFVERATASLDSFALTDAEAPVVGEICRRLDGNPLAIELAAARVDFFGVRGLAARLDDRLSPLSQGRRTALPRHQTLRATLDWSHQLLPVAEQVILRRLAVLRGRFTLEAALAIADAGADDAVMEGIANLVAKSLIVADASGEAVHYRLLETSRAYAAEKLAESGETQSVARRHARHFRTVLTDAEADWQALEREHWLRRYAGCIDDVRAAIDWAFAPRGEAAGGDAAEGILLVANSAPLWLALSLIDEFRDRAQTALAAIAETPHAGTEIEARLCIAAGSAIYNTMGPTPRMAELSARALAIGQALGAAPIQLRALWALARERYVQGDYRSALAHSEAFGAVATASGDPAAGLVLDRMLSLALHLVGRPAAARIHADRAVNHPAQSIRNVHNSFHEYDNRIASRTHLSRVLWLQGLPDQAFATVSEGVAIARELAYPPALCFILAFAAGPVSLWTGNDEAAASHVALLLEQSANLSFSHWQTWRTAYSQALRLKALPPSPARTALAQGLLATTTNPIHTDILATFDPELAGPRALARAQAGQADWCAAEVLRAEGMRRAAAGDPGGVAMVGEARALAHRQGALSWELRAATSLAELAAPGARDGLAEVLARFTEGYATADHRRARRVLEG